MEPVPWRHVKSWNCITCGICCKEFDVILGYWEWADRDLFVYVDPSCSGLTWGFPMGRFMHETLPEFIAIALGRREKQFYSTCRFANYG